MLSTTLLRAQALLAPAAARISTRHYSSAQGPNREIIQMLTRYMEEEKASEPPNTFKVRAYARAIKAIGQLPEPVRSAEQVRNLNGVGIRIANRVDAFLSGIPYNPDVTARSKPRKPSMAEEFPTEHTEPTHSKYTAKGSLEDARKRQITSSFKAIDAIGPVKAAALYRAGCRSIADLKKPEFFELLSPVQRISVQYLEHLECPVTSEQASTVRDFVEQNISSKYTVSISGDFRRGSSSAPHITLLVLHSHPDTIIPPADPPTSLPSNSEATSHSSPLKPTKPRPPFTSDRSHNAHINSRPNASPLFTEIIAPLESRGLVAATLSAGVRKWIGVVRIPEHGANANGDDEWQGRAKRMQGVQSGEGKFRRMEIFYASHRSAGAASIALTGDSAFNLSIRAAASRLGYSLNEYGLWRWRGVTEADPPGEFSDEESVRQYGGYWDLVEGVSAKEEDIFEAVRMEWVAPDRRNFQFLDEKVASPKKRGRK
ncbi:hypothetical protein PAXINDRAFT_129848 [Paxillus involutus ATCC 200175]|nr:hypothetical protein PAXINDRAFT_129848 [Paxillus involutus ATCC 200175]